jgi:hypothetical protein
MSRQNQRSRSSRRTFLKATAAVTAGTVLSRRSLWGQSRVAPVSTVSPRAVFPAINRQLMVTPQQAWDWHAFKSQCGPTSWTQTYAQVDTEAGPAGFDKNDLVQQVAGLTQIAGALMLVDPRVIDLGWGELKSAIVALKDTGFVAPEEAAVQRLWLLDQYVAAFRHVEAGARDKGATALKDLSTSLASRVTATDRAAMAKLVDAQLATLT